MSGRPQFDTAPWTEADDRILLAAYANEIPYARIVQDYFPRRSVAACIQRRYILVNGRPVEKVGFDSVATGEAKDGSARLLRAQLIHGQHNITDPAKFREVCQQVGLAA